MREIPVGKSHTALVDDSDYAYLSKFKWHLSTSPGKRVVYALTYRDSNGNPVAKHKRFHSTVMHKLLTGNEQTDHVNLNGLDNQRSNLRAATGSENCCNKPKKRGNYTSKYIGVYKRSDSNTWRVVVTVRQKKTNVGSFKTELEAARAYDEAALKLHGEFARLNFPNSTTSPNL